MSGRRGRRGRGGNEGERGKTGERGARKRFSAALRVRVPDLFGLLFEWRDLPLLQYRRVSALEQHRSGRSRIVTKRLVRPPRHQHSHTYFMNSIVWLPDTLDIVTRPGAPSVNSVRRLSSALQHPCHGLGSRTGPVVPSLSGGSSLPRLPPRCVPPSFKHCHEDLSSHVTRKVTFCAEHAGVAQPPRCLWVPSCSCSNFALLGLTAQ